MYMRKMCSCQKQTVHLLQIKIQIQRTKNTLDELVDLHVSLKCVIVNNCSKYHTGFIWPCGKVSSFPNTFQAMCHSMTLLCLLFQVSQGYSYFFNPSALPMSASK